MICLYIVDMLLLTDTYGFEWLFYQCDCKNVDTETFLRDEFSTMGSFLL